MKAIENGDKHIAIFTDSLSAAKSIQSTLAKGSDKIFENRILDICNLQADVLVHTIWVPAHMGIIGNETADELAKEAKYPLSIQSEPKDLMYDLNRNIFLQWQTFYNNNTRIKGRQLEEICNGKLYDTPWFIGSSLEQSNIKTICRIMTGHSYNDKILYMMKLADDG